MEAAIDRTKSWFDCGMGHRHQHLRTSVECQERNANDPAVRKILDDIKYGIDRKG